MGITRRFVIAFLVILAGYALLMLYGGRIAIPHRQQGFVTEFYFNRYLDGSPDERWEDLEIDFNDGSHGGLFRSNDFSVRWSGWLPIPRTGMYRFGLLSDDGSRLSIDGRTVIDLWFDHAVEDASAEVRLTEGWHRVVVEFYQKSGQCAIMATMTDDDGETKVLGKAPVSKVEVTDAAPAAWLRKLACSKVVRGLVSPAYVLLLLAGGLLLITIFIPVEGAADRRNYRILYVLFVLLLVTCYLPRIFSGGYHVFAYLHSVVNDFDLKLGNQYRLASDIIHDPPVSIFELMVSDNRTVRNNEGIGTAVLWFPTYVIGNLITRWMVILFAADSADGTSIVEIGITLFGSVICGLLALVMCYALLRRSHTPAVAMGALSGAWFGFLIVFMFKAPAYPQCAQACLASLFVILWSNKRYRRSTGDWYRLAAAAAGMMLTGFTAAPYLLLPIHEWLTARRRNHAITPSGPAGFALIVGLAVAMQAIVWRLVNPVGPALLSPESLLPGPAGILLGTHSGLFLWFPVTIAAATGIISKLRRDRDETTWLLAAVGILILSAAAGTRVTGWIIGAQNVMPAFPIICLGLAWFLARPSAAFPARLCLVLAATWSFFVYAAFERGLIREHHLTLSRFLGQLAGLSWQQVFESWKYSFFVKTSSTILYSDQYAGLLFIHFLLLFMVFMSLGCAYVVLRRVNHH
ncbi:hypothetical protein JW905_17970 [bacterium]|nr:hypothetical protein [candidate division CSSED10-310 bacterium]